MSPRFALFAFVLLSLGGGGLIGLLVETGDWYQSLAKPAFNPPGFVFGPVWTVLYILIGFAGFRVWRAGLGRLQRLWWAQLALNFAWPVVFFSAHALTGALAVIVLLVLVILAFVSAAWTRERLSALLFLPYALWTLFAAVLNASIVWMN
ncbi:MAG: TspO/MBR family protein [Pseudomonadota bacterium]|nr:TspO/MBR family protein [Pseudomonadota bacterium]